MKLVVFQGDMTLKCSMKHQNTPFLIETRCSNLAAVSVFAGLVLTSTIKEDVANASGLAP